MAAPFAVQESNMENISLQHWNYFLALESDLGKLARFVEPTEANFRTFSLEIVRLFLAACSEIDVVAKQSIRRAGSWLTQTVRRNK